MPRALWGRNKGLRCILAERPELKEKTAALKGCCENNKHPEGRTDCCCTQLLASQPDFTAECSALQHVVEERVHLAEWRGRSYTTKRHICVFLPKFHCELNWIERCWAAAKHYARSHCLYTLPGLRATIPIALSQDISDLPEHLRTQDDLPVCPLHLQRRWSRISHRYAWFYLKGSNGSEAIEGVQRLKSSAHRDVSRMRNVEARMADEAIRAGL